MANYPYTPFGIGDIITLKDEQEQVCLINHQHIDEFGARKNANSIFSISELNNYPHLFKPLHWWEDRRPDDMPEYLRWTDTGVVCKYHSHIGAYFYLEDDNGFGYALINTLPATKEEYEDYLKTTNQLNNE